MNEKEKRLYDAAQRAKDAFWGSLAESYPEIDTGDIDPLTAIKFSSHCMIVAQEWVEANTKQKG